MSSSQLLLRPLPFPALLALRYLRSTRKDAFVSFLSTVATLGIAVGVAALILVLAALAGLHERLLGQILGGTPHLEILLPPEAGTEGAEAARDAAAALAGVRSAQRVAAGQGWLVYDGVPQPLKLIGYEGELPPSFPQATGRAPGLYVAADLAARWGVEPGERLEVVSPRPGLTPMGPQPRVRFLKLAGTFTAFASESDQRAALPLGVAESLLGRPGRRIYVTAGSLQEAAALKPALEAAVAAALRTVLPAVSVQPTVRTWKELNRSLYFVLAMEKTLLIVAVALILLVASLALVVDLGLIIASKRAELGMLGTMGADPGALRSTFLLLGGLLAALGILLGTVVGVGGAWLLDRFHLLSVPGQVMFVDYIPFRVLPKDLILVLGLTVGLVLAAAAYSGHRAAALSPVEALRR